MGIKESQPHKYGTHKWTIAFYLSVFLGMFGADKLYLGQYGLFVLKFITLGGFGFWWLIDIILLLNFHEYGDIQWILPKRKIVHVAICVGIIVMFIILLSIVDYTEDSVIMDKNYTNEYYGYKVSLPTTWHVSDIVYITDPVSSEKIPNEVIFTKEGNTSLMRIAVRRVQSLTQQDWLNTNTIEVMKKFYQESGIVENGTKIYIQNVTRGYIINKNGNIPVNHLLYVLYINTSGRAIYDTSQYDIFEIVKPNEGFVLVFTIKYIYLSDDQSYVSDDKLTVMGDEIYEILYSLEFY